MLEQHPNLLMFSTATLQVSQAVYATENLAV
jgi:hypothetical protein